MITTEGIGEANKILQSTDKKTPGNKNTYQNSKTKKTKSPPDIKPEEFEYMGNAEKNIPSLKDFFNKKNPHLNNAERILTIGYYIINFLHKDEFSEGNIEFGYRILNLQPRPAYLHQAHLDLKNKTDKQWIDQGSETNRWKLTRLGRVEIEDNLPRKTQMESEKSLN